MYFECIAYRRSSRLTRDVILHDKFISFIYAKKEPNLELFMFVVRLLVSSCCFIIHVYAFGKQAALNFQLTAVNASVNHRVVEYFNNEVKSYVMVCVSRVKRVIDEHCSTFNG